MHCRHCSSPPPRERGAALVLALLVFALSSILIVAMTRDFNRVYQQGSNIFLAAQSSAYLRGAEGLASLALLADSDADRKAGISRDDLEEIWAREATPYPLEEGGWLVGSLEDLQGRFNLNRLAGQQEQGEGRPRFNPSQAQFIRLLLALGQPALSEQEAIVITRAIGDWLDADNNTRLDGAEDDLYFGLTPSYRAGNRAMASISELRAVNGVTSELYEALSPWVTVWPEQPAPLNIHTAPAMVLRSLGEDASLMPLSESDGEALVQHRQENGFTDMDDFFAHPALVDQAQQMAETRKMLGESSAFFLLQARVEVADRNTQLYSVLERSNRQINVVLRTSGAL